MKIGELFAGIGGASLAVSAVYPGASTVWQADLVGEAVRSRRFPGAQQLVGDVREVDPLRLPRVDLLTAGFPCQDLSVAGKQAGLDGARSRLYREVLRFCGARRDDLYADATKDEQGNPRPWRVVFGGGHQPERVLIENTPKLIKLIPRLAADFRALGYGLTWTVCEAADAGLPHLRRRVFVLAELDRAGRGAVEVDRAGRWQPEGLRAWPTPRADEARTSGGRTGRDGVGESLTYAVRPWATPRASDADRGSDPDRKGGGTGGIVGQVRLWATPTASNPNETEDPAQWEARRARAAAKHRTNGIGEPLGQQVRTWPTALSSDAKDVKQNGEGSPALNHEARQRPQPNRRLSPAWVEALMGYPIGWTDPDADLRPTPGAVRGRYPEDWDRAEPWPGFAWEPPRTLPDGVKAPGRAARLRALGNAWVPAQGALALRALVAPAQADLFGGAR